MLPLLSNSGTEPFPIFSFVFAWLGLIWEDSWHSFHVLLTKQNPIDTQLFLRVAFQFHVSRAWQQFQRLVHVLCFPRLTTVACYSSSDWLIVLLPLLWLAKWNNFRLHLIVILSKALCWRTRILFTTHMLVDEKIKSADSGGIGALSISSVEAALALSLLSEIKQAFKFSTMLKK